MFRCYLQLVNRCVDQAVSVLQSGDHLHTQSRSPLESTQPHECDDLKTWIPLSLKCEWSESRFKGFVCEPPHHRAASRVQVPDCSTLCLHISGGFNSTGQTRTNLGAADKKSVEAGSSTKARPVLMVIWVHIFFSFSTFTAQSELLRGQKKKTWIKKPAWVSHYKHFFCLVTIFNLDNRGSINHCLVFKGGGSHKSNLESFLKSQTHLTISFKFFWGKIIWMFSMQVKIQNKWICQKVILFFKSNKNEPKSLFGAVIRSRIYKILGRLIKNSLFFIPIAGLDRYLLPAQLFQFTPPAILLKKTSQ